MKKLALIGVIALVVFGCVLAAGCTSTTTQTPLPGQTETVSITSPIYVNENFKTITLDITAEDFEKAGFKPGDSVNIKFSNGIERTDIPYVTGVFVKGGQLIVLNRSSVYNTIEIAIVGTGNEWATLGVTPADTVTITLNQQQKYADMQKLNTLKYGKDKTKFSSDEEFTNFRAISGGNLKENFIYRGASAIDNKGGRVADVNTLLEKHGIKTLVDLADTEEKIAGFQKEEGHSAPYFDKLYENGNVIVAGMTTAINNEDSHTRMVAVFKEMSKRDGPFYLFCLEGKNRTGLAAMLLEALAGATYEQMEDDFMQTFTNYYKVKKNDGTTLYDQIVDIKFKETLEVFADSKKGTDYQKAAKDYLLSGGMTEEEISALLAKITK